MDFIIVKILMYVFSAMWGVRICDKYGDECLFEFILFITITCLIVSIYM